MNNSLLKSENIRLRAVEPSDALLMYEIENDPGEWFYSSRIAPLSMHALSRYARETVSDPFVEKQLRLIIELNDETPCGIIDLYDVNVIDRTAFVGIVIAKEYRKRGLGREALGLLINYCKIILQIRVLGAKIAGNNFSSLNLFKTSGFECVGRLPNWIVSPDGIEDLVIMCKKV